MKKDSTLLVVLIDKSGSMTGLKKDVIGGFNNLIAEQKKLPGELKVTLVQFDTIEFKVVNNFTPVESVELLNEHNYVPTGGTPLNDCLARLINETGAKLAALTESERPEKVIFTIITDGEENSSHEYTTSQVKKMIEHQEQKYAWKFMYIGANQDSFREGGSRGIGSTLNFAGTAGGVNAAFSAYSQTVGHARSVDLDAFVSTNYSDTLSRSYTEALKETPDDQKKADDLSKVKTPKKASLSK